MAQEAVTTGRGTQRIGPFAGPPVRLSWGAIFAGAFAALGVGILLFALGFALGLTSINPSDPSSLRGSGIFTGVWSLVTAFIALFIGGLVASRGSGVMTKAGGTIHGLVMWAVTTVVGTWLLLSLLGNVVGTVASVGRTAVTTGAGAIAGAAGGADQAAQLAQTLGIDAQDALAPINQRLRAQGKPEVTPEQLQAAIGAALQEAVRQGRLDRQLLVSSIAENTALTRADARDLASRLEQQIQTARGSVGDALQSAQTAALTAAEDTGKAFWGVFIALLLGMLSAVLGATLGVSKRKRLWAQSGPAYVAEPFPGQPRTIP